MRTIKLWILAVLLLPMVSASVVASEKDAVILLDKSGCTGFMVLGDLLVTAKHCKTPSTMFVKIKGKHYTATKQFDPKSQDGPVVFSVTGGPHESLPISDRVPVIGDDIYSMGYPHGRWSNLKGNMLGYDDGSTNLNHTNHKIEGGNSGGPLLNAQGEVIGVALISTVHSGNGQFSGFTTWETTVDAITVANGKRGPPKAKSKIVVFTRDACPPCKRLEDDVRSGEFKEYDFDFVGIDSKEYREFKKQTGYNGSARTPLIWVKGTKHYKIGYRNSGGLLGWFKGVFRALFGGIFGRPDSMPAPEPDLGEEAPIPDDPIVPIPGPEFTEPNPESEVIRSTLEKLIADVLIIKDQGLAAKKDAAEFQKASIIGKVQMISDLKADASKIQTSIGDIRGDLETARSQFKDDPKAFLWGVFAVITGLLRKRLLNDEKEVA